MRLLVSLAVAGLLAAGFTARAEDLPKPKGAIGVKLKVEDGKILVFGTIDNSPAAKAGLKEGDVIVKVDDHAVKQTEATTDDLQELVKRVTMHVPGDKIKVTVKRDGKDMTVEVTVGKPGEILPEKDG